MKLKREFINIIITKVEFKMIIAGLKYLANELANENHYINCLTLVDDLETSIKE